MITADLKYSRLTNWFGSDIGVREKIAAELKGFPLVVIPFAGSMSILPLLTAKKVIASDLHRHLINLANVAADPVLGPKLYRRLRRAIFHPQNLLRAQNFCAVIEAEFSQREAGLFRSDGKHPPMDYERRLAWAEAYFITSWMGRGGASGTDGEFNGALPIRFSPNGGGSGQRFCGSVDSIPAWRRIFRRLNCEFSTDDCFDLLAKVNDDPKCAIYSDAPWVGAGAGYKHSFTEKQHRRLAAVLGGFTQTKVVIRYDDDPLVRELYADPCWRFIEHTSRGQANNDVKEVLIVSEHREGSK